MSDERAGHLAVAAHSHLLKVLADRRAPGSL